MPRVVALWFVLALALLALPAAGAARRPVHVLIIQSDDAVEQAKALTSALSAAVGRARGYELAKGEYSLEVLSLALGCAEPPDAECLTRIGVKIGSSRYVWGTMARQGDKVVATLHLWQRGGTMTDIRLRYSAALSDPEDDALRELAARAFQKLAGEGRDAEPITDAKGGDRENGESDAWREETGLLSISAGDVDGELVIDGRPAGRIRGGSAEREVSIGEHYVVVRAPGYREAVGTVNVTGRKRARLTLYPERLGSVRSANHGDPEASSSSGAGWWAIGIGGAILSAGVYSAVKVQSLNDSSRLAGYKAAFRPSQNVCAEAEKGTVVPGQAPPGEIADICTEARTYEALQYVFFGLGAVAVGTGVLILLTDDSGAPKQAGLRVTPEVAPGRGAVNVRLRF